MFMDASPITGNLQTQKRSAKTNDRGHPLDQSRMHKPQQDTEFWPLSGKPYFYVVLGKLIYGKRFQLAVPRELSEKLPTSTVPAKIVYRKKVWDLVYLGEQNKKRFGNEAWGKFVTDNNLVAGDACVFELMEGSSKSSIVKFKVQVLRSNLPSELLEKAEGFDMSNPIAIE
ncbi:hypothetical protein L2E82_39586 [Cichorium intybus]|uniref:Uncharacterized protein n=1 Tax=Cichorium intybus TaxID=13427 RepID=A0ACB9AIG2_CICIN|nr:hypothetical protein L2E82_39586 [Cichorium intybus]